MMMKRICGLACAIFLSCTATTSFAIVDLTNFDDGTTQGWASNSGSIIITSTSYDSGIHATTGTNSLNVFAFPSAGFQWAMVLDNNDFPNLASWLISNPVIEADVSWKTSEWSIDPDGSWARWDQVAFNSGAGWKQTNDSMITDAANPSYPGSWDQTYWGATHQRTIRWDLTSLIAGNEAAILGGGWAQLYMSVNFDGAYNTAPGYSFWIDSIRLLPEPSSFALFGISGAFALTRRRRL
jgi:hypothetical protein